MIVNEISKYFMETLNYSVFNNIWKYFIRRVQYERKRFLWWVSMYFHELRVYTYTLVDTPTCNLVRLDIYNETPRERSCVLRAALT